MELDILHRAVAPEIVEFYGAFFIESCVYYCMEYMDAGSLDKLQGAGVPEGVLARIAACMVRGLKFLKDELQIIHRGMSLFFIYSLPTYLTADVKPTNVLVNRKGEIKLCDFGVSGQLEKSLAKTNIGCQSYMAVGVSCVLCPVLSEGRLCSLNVSKANHRTILEHIRFPPMFGPLDSLLLKSASENTPILQRRTLMFLRS
jgi:Protein kinase domain